MISFIFGSPASKQMLKPNKALLLFIGAFLIPLCALRGQDPAFQHYLAESGLASNEVYNIVFDEKMVLWAATNRGISRYDGKSWRTFTTSDGLRENVHLRAFYLQAIGEVWSTTYSNHLSKQVYNRMCVSPYSHLLSGSQNVGKFVQMLTMVNDTIWVSFNNKGLYYIPPDSTWNQVTSLFDAYPNADVCLIAKNDGYYWDIQTETDHDSDQKTSIKKVGDHTYINLHYTDKNKSFRKYIHRIGTDPDHYLLSVSNHLLYVRDGRLVDEKLFDHEIMSVFVDREGNFWIGVDSEGVYQFPNGSLNQLPRPYLTEEEVTGIAQDHEGNYWISTEGNGVFMMNTHRMSLYYPPGDHPKDLIVRSFCSLNGKIYYGTEGGGVYRIDDLNSAQKFSKELVRVNGPVRRMLVSPQNTILLMSDHLIEMNAAGDTAGLRRFPSYPYSFSIIPGSEDVFVTFSNAYFVLHPRGRLFMVRSDTIKKHYPDSLRYHRAFLGIRVSYYDHNDSLWLGTQHEGVIKKEGKRLSFYSENDSLLLKRPTGMAELGEHLVVSGNDYGLVIIHPDKSTSRVNTSNSNISSDIVDAIFAEDEKTLWVGTGQGLNRIRFNPATVHIDSIDYFRMREGIPSNRIYQIGEYHDSIWVATSRGLVVLTKEAMIPTYTSPKLIINDFLVNGNPQPIRNSYILGRAQNSLTISFNAISYRKHLGIKQRYQLVGYDRDWVESENLEAVYNSLRGGKYSFNLEAWYPENPSKKDTDTITIEIEKRFHETIFFIVILILLSLGGLILLVTTIINSIKAAENRKQQLLMSEKKALLAQMNPHFIFNSLNSIQYFILQNDEFQANNYLASFSSLIRRILDNSKKNLITLSDELDTLDLYLNMEKLRFEEDFDFFIRKDPRIDYAETLIPPMMIQPFVENAIWHGISPLGRKGLLTISFSSNNHYFICTIEDNGVGREQSAHLKTRRTMHTSTGLSNVEERIRLMNKTQKYPIKLSIEDLHHPDGSAAGTRVELVIPLQWN